MRHLLLVITAITSQSVFAEDKKAIPGNPTELSSPKKILFVGNSFTYWNNGLWHHMEQLVQYRPGQQKFKAERVVRGGASLKVMWEKTRARTVIAEGAYDVVVLQEDIPETNVESFYKYARKFDSTIRRSGAQAVFFMAWPYKRLGWIAMKEIARAHRTIGAQLGARIAPVGIAWERAMKERPGVNMYAKDREHPSI